MRNIGYSLLKVKINKINNEVSELIFSTKIGSGLLSKLYRSKNKMSNEELFLVNMYYEILLAKKN